MTPDIVSVLGKFGLKDSEAEIWVICLQHADGLYVHEITRLSKQKRTTVDLIIDRLQERGYLTRKKIGQRYLYNAVSPDIIYRQQKDHLDALNDILPKLQALSPGLKESDIRFFPGKQGVRQLYRDLFVSMKLEMQKDDPRAHLSISSGADIEDLLQDTTDFLEGNRLEIGFPVKIIAPASAKSIPAWQPDKDRMREVRYFDDSLYPFSISLDIYADKVSIHTTSGSVDGFLIQNGQISESLRHFFHFAWAYLDEDGKQ